MIYRARLSLRFPQGGVKAVVYTDVIQTLVMFFGVLAVVIVVCRNMGGIEEVWEVAGQGGRLEFFKYVRLLLVCVAPYLWAVEEHSKLFSAFGIIGQTPGHCLLRTRGKNL